MKPAKTKDETRAWPALLFLAFSLALFGGVFYYIGGLPTAMNLISQVWPGVLGAGPAQPTAEATVTVDAAAIAAAKMTYAEQIESQQSLLRLADGDVESFKVDSVKSLKDTALVDITARFRDQTSAPGQMRFVRKGGLWYFVTITGLRTATTNGMADFVNTEESIAPTGTPEERLAEVGVEKPDQGVLQTIAQQQVINQPVVNELLAGEYDWYELGTPVAGSRTFTIPVSFGGSEGTTSTGRLVMLDVHVEGKDRVFITTLSEN